MRVGIMTGGGDCSSLNATIRGVAKTLIAQCKAEIIGIEDGFKGLIEKNIFELSTDDFDGLISQGGTILGTCNKATPMNYKGKNVCEEVADYYKSLNLDCIVALGGDGTMSLCHEISKYGINFIGIPKTIDNDLMHTDRTFGFDTAVSIVTECIDRLHTTGKSHHRVMIIETMGRYAGWIALYAGVAGDADIILIPEFPYDLDYLTQVLKERAKTKTYSVIVVAEGALPLNGERVVSKTVSDSPDPIRLGGIGKFLESQLNECIDMEIRTTVLGHIQRGGQPTSFDRIFATNLGCYAAKLVQQGKYDQMVCVKGNRLGAIPLADVANQTRMVDASDMTFISALSSGISFGSKDAEQVLLKPEAEVCKLC